MIEGFFPSYAVASVRKSAGISDCGRYRWWLKRVWDESLPEICWIMLNPSFADAEINDPTICRCIGFSKTWGAGGIYVVNLFAWRATNPRELAEVADPIGPDNEAAILEGVKGRRVVAAWGTGGPYLGRDERVLGTLRSYGIKVECLGTTKWGKPIHPLYVAGSTAPRELAGK